MKKFLFLFLCIVFTSPQIYAQVSIGIRGGFNLSAMKFETAAGQKSGGIGNGNQLKNLQADILLNIPLQSGFYLQPAFRYITKGTFFESGTPLSDGEAGNSIKVRYIEMPVDLVYKFSFPGFKLCLGAGPYVAYGLGGNYRTDLLSNGKVVSHGSRSLAFGEEDNIVSPGMYLNRWDAGLNTMLGVELNSMVMIGANYSLGMVDIDNSAAYKVKNSSLGISIGILLNREDY
jgi:hypothetical protein